MVKWPTTLPKKLAIYRTWVATWRDEHPFAQPLTAPYHLPPDDPRWKPLAAIIQTVYRLTQDRELVEHFWPHTITDLKCLNGMLTYLNHNFLIDPTYFTALTPYFTAFGPAYADWWHQTQTIYTQNQTDRSNEYLYILADPHATVDRYIAAHGGGDGMAGGFVNPIPTFLVLTPVGWLLVLDALIRLLDFLIWQTGGAGVVARAVLSTPRATQRAQKHATRRGVRNARRIARQHQADARWEAWHQRSVIRHRQWEAERQAEQAKKAQVQQEIAAIKAQRQANRAAFWEQKAQQWATTRAHRDARRKARKTRKTKH